MLVASDVLAWAGVIGPMVAILIGGLGVYAAFHPHQQERRQREEAMAHQTERLQNAADLLYGSEGDMRRGIRPVKGLVQRVEDLERNDHFVQRVLGIDGEKPDKSFWAMADDGIRERREIRGELTELRRWLEEAVKRNVQ